jgi:hypothetical protein
VAVILRGQARAGGHRMTTGQVWLLPADLAPLEVTPEPAVSIWHGVLPKRNAR